MAKQGKIYDPLSNVHDRHTRKYHSAYVSTLNLEVTAVGIYMVVQLAILLCFHPRHRSSKSNHAQTWLSTVFLHFQHL
jgi:hypothetical protein